MILLFMVNYNYQFEEHMWAYRWFIHRDTLEMMFGRTLARIENEKIELEETPYGMKRRG